MHLSLAPLRRPKRLRGNPKRKRKIALLLRVSGQTLVVPKATRKATMKSSWPMAKQDWRSFAMVIFLIR